MVGAPILLVYVPIPEPQVFAKLMQVLRAGRARQAGPSGASSTPAQSGPVAHVPDPTAAPASEASSPVTASSPAATPDPSRVSEAVRAKLRTGAAAVRAGFSEAGRYPDVTAILDGLTEPGAIIRQPPLAAQAVLALLRRRNYGLDEMTKLIERDPALSQSLLRHANSAFYAGMSAQPVLGIKSAIQRVGTNGVHASVMFEVLQGEISRPGGGLDRYARLVWEHLVRAAPIARTLARAFHADPEEAFTLALLHDVGKLVFFDRVAAVRGHVRRDLVLPVGFVNAALRELHEPLGGLAVLEWGLDARAATVVATHHRRGEVLLDDPLGEAVYAAERLDIAMQKDGDPDIEAIWAEGDLHGPVEAAYAWLTLAQEEEEERRAKKERRLAALG